MLHKVTFFNYENNDPTIAARAWIWQTVRSTRQKDLDCIQTQRLAFAMFYFQTELSLSPVSRSVDFLQNAALLTLINII
jgi:hypothetical protein